MIEVNLLVSEILLFGSLQLENLVSQPKEISVTL
jgi:hypothetical protein